MHETTACILPCSIQANFVSHNNSWVCLINPVQNFGKGLIICVSLEDIHFADAVGALGLAGRTFAQASRSCTSRTKLSKHIPKSEV